MGGWSDVGCSVGSVLTRRKAVGVGPTPLGPRTPYSAPPTHPHPHTTTHTHTHHHIYTIVPSLSTKLYTMATISAATTEASNPQ